MMADLERYFPDPERAPAPSSNYFKSDGEIFFFADEDLAATARAYELAKRHAVATGSPVTGPRRVVVYRRPPTGGPWRDLLLVGENPDPLSRPS